MVMRSSGTLAVLLGTLALASGCGTDAVGVESCRRVEEARCQQAPACGIPLQPPYSTSGSDVDACIRFYDNACLHGLASGSDPGAIKVNACVAAINSNGCSIVLAPETDPACSWLVPPAAPPPTPADASDGALEAGDASPESG